MWKWPLEPDAYVPCLPCARLWHVDVETGALEPVLLSLEPAELQLVFDELVQAWFALEQRRSLSSKSTPEERAARAA